MMEYQALLLALCVGLPAAIAVIVVAMNSSTKTEDKVVESSVMTRFYNSIDNDDAFVLQKVLINSCDSRTRYAQESYCAQVNGTSFNKTTSHVTVHSSTSSDDSKVNFAVLTSETGRILLAVFNDTDASVSEGTVFANHVFMTDINAVVANITGQDSTIEELSQTIRMRTLMPFARARTLKVSC